MLIRIFFRGLVALLPIGLSLFVLYKFFNWVEGLCKQALDLVFPNMPYWPGLGVLVGIGLIFGLGVLMSSSLAQKAYGAVEFPFKNVPLVKTIYMAIKDLTQFFSKSQEDETNKVVRIRWPGLELEMIGLVTREDLSTLPNGLDKEGRVAVYIPMSYIIGGYTVFAKKEWIQEVDMSVEQAMKSAITAWVTTHKE